MQACEFAILDWIQENLRCEFLDALMPAVSRLSDHGEIWILLALVLLVSKRYRHVGVSVAMALILDLICCNLILKPLIGRARPFSVNPAAELLIAPPLDASFPSGHTAASFAAATALWTTSKSPWMGIPAMALAILTAFSRLYLYVHWPSDVLGGAVLGIALGSFSGYLVPYLAHLATARIWRK